MPSKCFNKKSITMNTQTPTLDVENRLKNNSIYKNGQEISRNLSKFICPYYSSLGQNIKIASSR